MTTTTTVSETLTRQALVAEASQVAGRREGDPAQWALKLEIKDISQFPTPCFLALDRAPSILKGSTHLVTMRRGKLKANKNGTYASDYFWELTGWDVPAPAPQAPAAQATSAPRTQQEPSPAAPVPWDAADTQSRISWAQAVNLAVETIGPKTLTTYHDDQYFDWVEELANRFYPLIRKGPTAQAEDLFPPEGDIDPEALAWEAEETVGDAPQRPLGPRIDVPVPAAVPRPTLPPFPIRGEKEAPVNFFLKVARERYGLKTQKEALAVIGGAWSGFVDKNGGDGETALQAGLKRLEETP